MELMNKEAELPVINTHSTGFSNNPFAALTKSLPSLFDDYDAFDELDKFDFSMFDDQPWREDKQKTVCNQDLSDSYTLLELADESLSPPVVGISEENQSPEEVTLRNTEHEKGLKTEHLLTEELQTEVGRESKFEEKGKKKKNGKTPTRTLQYPPCYICAGKASGDHYGVNSCEACKGFFRRYLLRKKGAYVCKRDGKCEIHHTKRGMCAGCRLAKCLSVGMSKDKCKLGRYNADKRTKMIQTVKELNETINLENCNFESRKSPDPGTISDLDMVMKTLANMIIKDDNTGTKFSDDLIPTLIKAKREMKPFGKQVCNPDEIQAAIKDYHEVFERKRQLYGEMRAVSKEEFTRLYNTYGIDVDDRLKDFHDCCDELEDEVYEICNFARHVPFFSKLSLIDQSNLMKTSINDIFVTLYCDGYDPDLEISLDRKKAFHVSEMDKIFSRDLVRESLNVLLKCKKLKLNETEQVLVMAVSLFFADRCPLENKCLVEEIQLSLTQLLKRQLEMMSPKTSRKRFTDIIEYLTSLRNVYEMSRNEWIDLCADEIYNKEFPWMSKYIVDEVDGDEEQARI